MGRMLVLANGSVGTPLAARAPSLPPRLAPAVPSLLLRYSLVYLFIYFYFLCQVRPFSQWIFCAEKEKSGRYASLWI